MRFCREKISNRYPFSTQAQYKNEVDLDAFTKFFGPKGIADQLINRQGFSSFVDMDGDPWSWKPFDSSPGIPEKALKQLQLAAKIEQAFFDANTSQPTIQFQLIPLAFSPTVKQFILEMGGQRVIYNPNALSRANLSWPGPNPNSAASIEFAGAALKKTEAGPWAWFKLLEYYRLPNTLSKQSNSIDVTFALGNHSAHFRILTDKTPNPFSLDLTTFHCPRNL